MCTDIVNNYGDNREIVTLRGGERNWNIRKDATMTAFGFFVISLHFDDVF